MGREVPWIPLWPTPPRFPIWKDQCVMKPGFSARTSWNTEETECARTLRERRAAGLPVLDLTASNPTRCGLEYDAARLLPPLADPSALDYDPDPRGMLRAREAVSSYYVSHRAEIDPEQIFLTTSTSEAYSYLFRLLCDPGDEVLIAQPSYPLFDFLADLDDVRLEPYPLFYDFGGWIDFSELERRLGPPGRGIRRGHPETP